MSSSPRRRPPPDWSCSSSAPVVTHLRARVFYNITFPGAYLATSAATLKLMVAH